MLEHVSHRVPVTALAYLDDNVVLAGEGSYIVAYDEQLNTSLFRLKVFSRQSIHGVLVLDREHVLVWGGRWLASLKTMFMPTSGLRNIVRVATFNLQDWILDVAASPAIENSRHRSGHCIIAAVTAHNALTLLSSDQVFLASSSSVDIEPAVPGSNCILYSARASWLSPFQCLIASGTAFGDVIVWSCSAHEAGSEGFSVESQVHYNFSAHEGSIFGVDISLPLLKGVLGGCERALASCSDDRTICIWDITDLPQSSTPTNVSARDTGFGGQKDGTTGGPPLLAKAMGHISRIWHVRFIWNAPPALAETLPLKVLSFGEDASVITWALIKPDAPGSDLLQLQLCQAKTETAHAGKHIWSVANRESTRFATGGADGAIALRTSLGQDASGVTGTSLITIVSAPFRAYGFAGQDRMVATLDDGRVLLIDIAKNQLIRSISPPAEELKGYSIIATTEGHVFFAGGTGHIYWISAQISKSIQIAEAGGKVAGLFVAVSTRAGVPALSVLAYALASPSLLLYNINLVDAGTGPDLLTPVVLDGPQNLIPTSFTTFMLGATIYAAVGTRKGGIVLFTATTSVQPPNFVYNSSIEDLHPNEAVTSLLWVANEARGSDAAYLHTTGRDGAHCLLAISERNGEAITELIHRLALPFGPNVESCAVAPESTNLWVWGFKSKQFVVFDISAQREIMRVACGGAHRNWAFQPTAAGGTFVWTQAGKVYKHTQTALPFGTINAGGHGREIKSVAISSTEPKIIATGAEDTNIKLSTVDHGGSVYCLQTLRKHNTGIQHLQWSEPLPTGQSLLFSSGGFEEFFVWAIMPSVPGMTVGVLCESIHPNSNKSDLRITAFEAVPVTVSPDSEHFQIIMTYSDSTLKKWSYARPDTWQLLGQADYLTSCLTATFSIPKSTPIDTFRKRLTTSTDGHLTLWTDDNSLSLQKRHKTHQNAILSCTSLRLDNGDTLIVTGGDDNALAFTRLSFLPQSTASEGHDFFEFHTLLLPGAHAAAITGLIYLPDSTSRDNTGNEDNITQEQDHGESNKTGCWLLSCSIDQVLKSWRVEIDCNKPGVDGIEIARGERGYTSVADVSGLEVVEQDQKGRTRVIVVGVGVDLWDIVLS